MTDHAPAVVVPDKKAKGRVESVAGTLLIVVFSSSFVGLFVGMLAGNDSVFGWGLASFVVSSLAVEVFFAWYPVESDDDAAGARSRRRLALIETLALIACIGVAWFISHERTIPFAILCAVGGGGIIVLFHALNNAHGSGGPETPQPLAEGPAEVSSEQAERFWAERRVRVIWLLLCLFEAGGLLGGMLAGVLLAGSTLAGALGVACLVFAPVALVSWALHKRYEIPLMTTMPARPQPGAHDVPEKVVYRASVFNAGLVFFAPAFVSVMLGAIIVSLGRQGPEPSFGNGMAALIIAATVAIVLCSVAAAVRVRRMRLEVAPDGLRIVNFWRGLFVPWDKIARIETAALWWLEGASIALATVSDQDVPRARGVRVQLKDPLALPLRISVVNFGDPHRDARLQRALVALRREGKAHDLPVGI